jgi:hypothetical protein
LQDRLEDYLPRRKIDLLPLLVDFTEKKIGLLSLLDKNKGRHAFYTRQVETSTCFLCVLLCCGSGMFIPDPDFYPSASRIPDPGSWIPDPKTATKERGEKKICCHTFFCSQKFHKIVNYFIIEMLKKKIMANFQRII